MEYNDALKLAKKTTSEEKRNCKHQYVKEYTFDHENNKIWTGDKVCVKCGETVYDIRK